MVLRLYLAVLADALALFAEGLNTLIWRHR